MRTIGLAVGLLGLLTWGATDAFAQTDAEVRGTILREANLGDRITVTLRDGDSMRGRLVSATDTLVLRHDGDQRTFNFTDIDRVSRRKNGILLGAIIGTAAGFAVGLPMRTYLDNEARDGDRALWVFVITGAAVGTGLDALMASERTIYRHPYSRRAFRIAPTKSGVSARWTTSW